MRYLVSPHAQGTPEWLQDRAGKATGSAIKAIFATVKSGEAAAKRDYRMQLAVERLRGAPESSGYVNSEMIWGTEQEPFSRARMEQDLGLTIVEAGFCYLPDLAAGCSVDGFIDNGEGIWESKSPKSTTHIRYLEDDVVPADYLPQITHNVWITGAKYAIFTSYDPRLPENLQLFWKRIEASELPLEKHEAAVRAFIKEVDELENHLRNLKRK